MTQVVKWILQLCYCLGSRNIEGPQRRFGYSHGKEKNPYNF
jgi:hypothetical protein